MEPKRYSDPALFLSKVEPTLLQNEVSNNLPLGILKRLGETGGINDFEEEPFMMVYSNEQDEPLLILIMTPPHHLILTGSSLHIRNIEQIVNDLVDMDIKIPSVIGSPDIVEPFTRLYAEKKDLSTEIEMNQRIYQLNHVIMPSVEKGSFRVATEKDRDLLIQWILDFDREAVEGKQTREWAALRVEKGIREASLFVWEHDANVVSMAGSSRPTAKGITITLVYTPTEERKKGYASLCVATLCQQLLFQGYQFCSLYTDLSNPTSNKIYQEIGFYPITDSIVIRFCKNKRT